MTETRLTKYYHPLNTVLDYHIGMTEKPSSDNNLVTITGTLGQNEQHIRTRTQTQKTKID